MKLAASCDDKYCPSLVRFGVGTAAAPHFIQALQSVEAPFCPGPFGFGAPPLPIGADQPASDADIGFVERAVQGGEPAFMGDGVVVEKDEQVTGRGAGPDVASPGEADVLLRADQDVSSSVGVVTGVVDDQVEMQDIFEYERSGVSARGKVLGQFHGCGAQPVCLERLKAYGVHLSPAIFTEVHEVKEK